MATTGGGWTTDDLTAGVAGGEGPQRRRRLARAKRRQGELLLRAARSSGRRTSHHTATPLLFVQKLQDKSFTKEEKMQVIEDVAEEFTIPFNTKAFERKIFGVPPNKKELLKKGSFNGVEVEASGRNGHRVDKHVVLDGKSKSILFPESKVGWHTWGLRQQAGPPH